MILKNMLEEFEKTPKRPSPPYEYVLNITRSDKPSATYRKPFL